MIRRFADRFTILPFAFTNLKTSNQDVTISPFLTNQQYVNPLFDGSVSRSEINANYSNQLSKLNGNFNFSDYTLYSNTALNGDTHELTLAAQINKHKKSQSIKKEPIRSPGL